MSSTNQPSPRQPRIGLYLGVSPDMGGVYQYSQALLDAYLALPGGQAAAVVYGHTSWEGRTGNTLAVGVEPRGVRRSLVLGTLGTLSGLPMSRWRRGLWRLDPVARALVCADCDLWLVSAHSFVCTQLPVRAVGTVHDLMHRYERRFRRDTPWHTYRWRERVFRNIARYAHAVLTESDLGRDQFVESYGADPRRVFSLPFIPPPLPDRPAPGFASRYDLPDRFLFYPAQFWEHKNHARLLRALAAVRRDCPDAHLALAGGLRLGYEAARRQASRLGLASAVTFLGYVPDADLAELYRRACGLVYPTFYGPTNIPPLEAFRLGCPVAASGIYAMPEQLGDAALLFDPSSETEMASAMRRLWTDDALCRTLVERGRARAAAWGPPQFAARLAEIVARLVDGERRPGS